MNVMGEAAKIAEDPKGYLDSIKKNLQNEV